MLRRKPLNICITAQYGGAFLLQAGQLHVNRAVIERTTSEKGGHVGALLLPLQGNYKRQVVMTLVELRQSRCGGVLFFQTAPSNVVLRAVSFSQPSECNATDPSSTATAPGVEPTQCGGSYTNQLDDLGTELEYGVCASASEGACSSAPLQGTSLETIFW